VTPGWPCSRTWPWSASWGAAAGLTAPFSVYLLTSFFRTIPDELLESAMADGASHFRLLWQIVAPLSAPAFVTLVVVNALWVWNELLIALVFLQDENARTLLQVKVEHADQADDLFAKLMGELVEPRREFIQDNALNVVNLDV